MARTARKKSGTGIYHILLRAENKLFLEDADREYFCMLLERYFTGKAEGRLYGYILSGTKAHLIASEGNAEIAEIIKPLCTSYARYFNRVHSVSGKLFNGRFKSEPVEDDSLAALIAFLYRNNPDDYNQDRLIVRSRTADIENAERLLFMDDYEHMTEHELSDVVMYICPDLDKRLTDAEKLQAVIDADTGERLRIGLIKKALGLTEKESDTVKRQRKQPEIKEEKKKDSKKNLSVWLL